VKPPRDATLDEPRLRLKLATRKAVKAVHGTALAAEVAGCRQQRISDCQLPNTPDFLRLDEAQAIEEAGRGSPDFPAITRAMARNHGFALLPLPDASSVIGTTDFHRALGDVSREAGEVVARVCAALADGKVDAHEVRDGQFRDEIAQAIASLAKLDALCAHAERGEG
jgi:hypothetical protein